MKREIKFRIWDKGKNRFIPEEYYAIINRTSFQAFGVMLKDWENYKEGEYFFDTAQIMEQFTGIIDRNGKEIYEGDIIICHKKEWRFYFQTSHIKERDKLEVVFSDVWASFGTTDGGAFFSFDCLGDFEVIGNIHETPELI